MNATRFVFRSIVTAGLLGLMACGCRHKEGAATPLLCYVGGTMRPAVQELVSQYEAQTKQKVEIDYADSGQLLIKIEQTRRGDVYICHDPFLAAAVNKGLVAEAWTVSALDPVIVVPKGNPKKITGFLDLARPGIRLIMTDSRYSTMGHVVDRMAGRAGISVPLASNIVSTTRGGGEAANAVGLNAADASVVWNAVAHLRQDKLDVIPLEPDFHLKEGVDAITSATYGQIEMDYIQVTAAMLKWSTQAKQARHFVEFLVSKESQKTWEKYGFSPLIPARSVHSVPAAEAGRSGHSVAGAEAQQQK